MFLTTNNAFKDSGGSAFTNGVTSVVIGSIFAQPALYYALLTVNVNTVANNEVAIVAANISDVSTTASITMSEAVLQTSIQLHLTYQG